MTGQREVGSVGAGEAGMFKGVPRHGRAGAWMLAAWLGVALAFVADAVPGPNPADWLYGVEARRDAHARVHHLGSAEARASAPAPALLAARRAAPGARRVR
jgi:hypothetical protein